MPTLINNMDSVKQVVSFDGMRYGRKSYPTDFDAVMEKWNKVFIAIEFSRMEEKNKFGQELCYCNWVDAVSEVRHYATYIQCVHNVPNHLPVDAAGCRVVKVRRNKEWLEMPPFMSITLREYVDSILDTYLPEWDWRNEK
jgi:hypothetical protein